MKYLAFALGLFTVLARAENSPASLPPQKLPRPVVYGPSEAAVSAAGGPAVVLAEKVKPVEYDLVPGGPCGGGTPYNSGMSSPVRSESRNTQPASATGSDGIGLWLPIGSGVAAVAGIGLIGFWFLRRSRV